MSRKRIFILASLILMAASHAIAGVSVSSSIKEVTLFSNQALIKREASVDVNEGTCELSIAVDARKVDRDSVSADIRGEGEIISVQFKEVSTKEASRESVKKLEDRLEELRRSRKALNDAKLVLKHKDTFLRSIIDFSDMQISREIKTSFPKTENLDRILEFIEARFQNVYKKRRGVDDNIEKINQDITIVEDELKALRASNRKKRGLIEIYFKSSRRQKIVIQAQYLVRKASWFPLYRVNIPPSLDEVELTMFSSIRQGTGEDWTKVRLAVSNVTPIAGAVLPVSKSWEVDLLRPETRGLVSGNIDRLKKMAGAPPAKEELLMESEQAVEDSRASYRLAEKTELPLSFEYVIPGRMDIESRDKETLLPLFSKRMKGEFYYYSVPRLNHMTFLTCAAKADRELLDGQMNVNFGGRFVGKTFLQEKKAGDDFLMNLGADREIKVKRIKTKDKIRETFLGAIERDTIVREMAFKMTLENLKKRPVSVKLLDAVPVSRTDKIQIKDVQLAPIPSERNFNDQEGLMLWNFETLEPSEKKEINVRFTITYPRDISIQGL